MQCFMYSVEKNKVITCMHARRTCQTCRPTTKEKQINRSALSRVQAADINSSEKLITLALFKHKNSNKVL